MENNIEWFDRYIDGELSQKEKRDFDHRLASDKEFAQDFRIYLWILRGMAHEAEQDNMEFGMAMKNVSEKDLLRIIGRTEKSRRWHLIRFRERWGWVASIAAVLAIGIFSVWNVNRNAMHHLDDTIVAYNYIPDSNRGFESLTPTDIPSLQKAYRDAPADDIQAQQDAGMHLAMAYLKVHNRKKAKETLRELSVRFADDEEYSALCNRILEQLK